jgi:outer membrane protein assembly factor BamB
VAFVCVDGAVMIVDAATGTMNGVGKTWGDAGARPAAGDGAVFVASLDQSLYAFNVDGGGQRWRIRTQEPINRAPAYFRGAVYVHVPGTGMVAVNSGTGNQLWKNGAIAGDVFAARKGNLIAWDKESGTATLIDAANGDIISTVKLPNVGKIVTSAFADGDWYVVSARGEVSKFTPKN